MVSSALYRPGAPERLDGVDVYYDFEWLDYFPDGRAQFRHGKALGQFVRKTCPDGKRPALLLTADPDAEERFHNTPRHHAASSTCPATETRWPIRSSPTWRRSSATG